MSTKNVLPDWWSFTFIGIQLVGLLPTAYQALVTPTQTFLGLLPNGFDPSTDNIKSSLRIEIANTLNAHSYLMILGLFVGCTLFARNSLKGQPHLQQRLIKLPIYAGLFSDIWIYTTLAYKLPNEMLLNKELWTDPFKGLIYGLPVATVLKLVWISGIGRDKV